MKRFSLLGCALVASLALAACGGGGSTGGSTMPSTGTGTGTGTGGGGGSTPTAVLVTTSASGNQAAGFTLYTLSDDTTTAVACTVASGCTGLWAPYTAGAAAAPATGLATGLTVFTRTDDGGAMQWALNGHPLYTYLGDPKAGVATGVGIVSFGGTWAAPAPPAAGTATVTGEPDAGTLSAAPAATTAPSSGGGYTTIR
jgi:predicted lipoprotein with Yx(FWY)xxD motif